MVKSKRPQSPHLQVYRPQLTSTMSILHRMTGLALVAGCITVVMWLLSIASSAECLSYFYKVCCHPLGCLILVGISFSYFYHLFNGIRHLVWDAGYGFNLRSVYRGGYLVLGLTIGATALIWAVILNN
jgi:succinate dehydrogenase / fumarate reductase cytochrome b subunit